MSQKKSVLANQGMGIEQLLDLMKPVSERCDPPQEAQNAALVAFELDAVSEKVSRFGWRDMDPRMKDRLTDDWVDVLRAFPIAEVKRGIGDCLDARPRDCPTEQAVKAAIMKRRGKAVDRTPKPSPQQAPASKVSADDKADRKAESAKIRADLGFSRMPTAD